MDKLQRSASLRSAISLAALLVASSASCAPASKPASGPIAEQVQASLAGGRASFDHAEWDRLLAAGTRDGLVDYAHFREHRSRLDAYLARVAEADLGSLEPAHLEALLINAYNAATIRSILDHPQVSSIREIDGVWDEATHLVGGFELTLDTIEHGLLRPYFKDPRIHFAVNCASLSCAPLPGWAFDGERLDDQLEERARAFLSDPRNVLLDDGVLRLSRYFDWYGDDFTAPGWEPREESIAEFVARYAQPPVGEFIELSGGRPKIEFFDYDWSLNQAP
jgi:hypothetical protein